MVFSTNLDPHDLADEAFLRRIQTKVLVENVSDEVFDQIFQRVVQTNQVPTEPGCAEYLRVTLRRIAAKVLRACYPMDIYNLVKAISEYEGRPVRMTNANIDRAVALYFAKSQAQRKRILTRYLGLFALGGAGFSLPIRAKLGLFLSKVAALRASGNSRLLVQFHRVPCPDGLLRGGAVRQDWRTGRCRGFASPGAPLLRR